MDKTQKVIATEIEYLQEEVRTLKEQEEDHICKIVTLTRETETLNLQLERMRTAYGECLMERLWYKGELNEQLYERWRTYLKEKCNGVLSEKYEKQLEEMERLGINPISAYEQEIYLLKKELAQVSVENMKWEEE